MRTALTLGLLILAVGCFRSRGTPDDASVSSDAGIDARTMPDGGDWPCGMWGDYYRCSCPGIRLDCTLLDLECGGPGVCVESRGDERGRNICSLPTDRPLTRHYCFGGDFCAIPLSDEAGGGCVDASYCRAAIELDLTDKCFYDDLTPFVDGPPSPTECPEPAVPLLPHCGGPCGPCPYVMGNFGSSFQQQQSCIGLNEERGYGLCAINGAGTCARPEVGGRPFYVEEFMIGYGVQLACMVLFDEEAEDGLADNGAWVPLDNCRDYVARFPGSYACVDTEWQRIE